MTHHKIYGKTIDLFSDNYTNNSTAQTEIAASKSITTTGPIALNAGTTIGLVSAGDTNITSTAGNLNVNINQAVSVISTANTVAIASGVIAGVQQPVALIGNIQCQPGTGTGGGFNFPVSLQAGSVATKVTSTDSLDLVLTNAAGSARTDAGTAGTLLIRKTNNVVSFSCVWGNLAGSANAVAAAALTFNETVPVRFRPVSNVFSPQAVTNNAALSAGVLTVNTSGVVQVNPTYGFGNFTNGAACNVFGNSPVTQGIAANI